MAVFNQKCGGYKLKINDEEMSPEVGAPAVLSVDWSGVRNSRTRAKMKRVLEDLESPVDFSDGLWKSFVMGDLPASPSRLLVLTDLSTCARAFRSTEIHRWTSAVRTSGAYILALVRGELDRRYADLVDDIVRASENRVSVCAFSPADPEELEVCLNRAIFSTDPLAILEVRYSPGEERLWLCFGDGRKATLSLADLGLADLSPPLLPHTATVSEDHDSIQVLRADGSVFDIDSAAVRSLIDEATAANFRDAAIRSDQELGRILRQKRLARGMTQVEMSQASGLEQSLISKLENGRHRPRFDTLRKYAVALGMTVPEALRISLS